MKIQTLQKIGIGIAIFWAIVLVIAIIKVFLM